jgi:hypothetical protein
MMCYGRGLEASRGVLGCYGRVRVHAQHSYPVYKLDGYAHSDQSDVNSVSSMVDYI